MPKPYYAVWSSDRSNLTGEFSEPPVGFKPEFIVRFESRESLREAKRKIKDDNLTPSELPRDKLIQPPVDLPKFVKPEILERYDPDLFQGSLKAAFESRPKTLKDILDLILEVISK